jgi:L-seryl-tRNA(Ser) seleniumtransferase
MVDCWVEGLTGVPGVAVSRTDRTHSGQPIPRALIGFEDPARRDAVISALWERTPRVAVLPQGEMGIGLNPQGLREGEERVVLEGMLSALQQRK